MSRYNKKNTLFATLFSKERFLSNKMHFFYENLKCDGMENYKYVSNLYIVCINVHKHTYIAQRHLIVHLH